MKRGKAAGYDSIYRDLLKEDGDILEKLAKLFSQCLGTVTVSKKFPTYCVAAYNP